MGSEPNLKPSLPPMPSTNMEVEDIASTKSRRYKKEVDRLEKRIKVGRAVVVKAITEVNKYSGKLILNSGIGGILPKLFRSKFDFARSANGETKRCRITLEIIED